MRLVFSNKEINTADSNIKTLKDYGITHNSVLFMVARLKGGFQEGFKNLNQLV